MSIDPSTKHLAHDLNNIFSRILNSVELLKRKVANPSEVNFILSNIESATYLASEMIDDTITGKDVIKIRRINLNSIINEIVRSASFQLKDKINFQTELASNLKHVSGKYSDYYRIILNIITNSIEAIPVKGRIIISTKNLESDNCLEVKIKDSGVGIDKNILPKIFDENFSTKNKVTVSGLGLSIVKKMIENYSGKLVAASEIGYGTEFTITLPIICQAEIENEPSEKTILIAEDESLLLELLVDLLQSYGYKTEIASNGFEVLVKLKNIVQPDLLIIDLKMPEMDGITCIKEIEKQQYQIPIICASGSPLDQENNLLVNKNLHYISKPYNFEELLGNIKELIR